MMYKAFAGITLIVAPLLVIGVQSILPGNVKPAEAPAPAISAPAPIVPVAPTAPPPAASADSFSTQPDTSAFSAPITGAGVPMTEATGSTPAVVATVPSGGSEQVYSDPVAQ